MTGANSGSGIATTEQLVREGATVLAACRRVGAGEEATVLYADKANRRGGWPMRSPNPLVYDDELADRLHEMSAKMVGL